MALPFALATCAWAQYTPTTMYAFPVVDGFDADPSGLISDKAGNLYGTTAFEGACGNPELCGSVFELSPASGGGWTETTIHGFTDATLGSPLTMDRAGNLYGVTFSGGSGKSYCNGTPSGCGTVFELSPSFSGWTLRVLHSFSGSDGAEPEGSLVLDAAGNLYGITNEGGTASSPGYGTVYELSPGPSGWSHIVLHRFTDGNDGRGPTAGLVMDAAGNLYGTAYAGGADGYGTAYKLTSNGTGGFRFNAIHAFAGGEKGANPYAPLLLDAAGNLYGTTRYGGSAAAACDTPSSTGCGVVFELLESSRYAEKILRVLQPTEDGAYPRAGVVADSAGNLFGSTGYGQRITGSVFELSPTESGYSETVLLTGSTTRGLGGFSLGVILDSEGNLYGPAGESGASVIFELSPPALGSTPCGGTATVIQYGYTTSCVGNGSNTTCTITPSSASGAGHLGAIIAWFSQSSSASSTGITQVSGNDHGITGWTSCPSHSCFATVGTPATGCKAGYCSEDIYYNPSLTGGDTSFTVTLGSPPPTYFQVWYGEWALPGTGGAHYDASGSGADSTACTSCAGQALTLTDTQDIVLQTQNSSQECTAISGPYSDPVDVVPINEYGGIAAAAIDQTSAVTPTYTCTSGTVPVAALALAECTAARPATAR